MKTAIIIAGLLIISMPGDYIIEPFNPPEEIVLLRTGVKECEKDLPFTRETIEYQYYVKSVLPSEWVSFWPGASLQAGAVAVKSYAWSKINVNAPVWDCHWSQVYNPEKRKWAADWAIDTTWDYWLVTETGDPVRTFYNVNSAGCQTQDGECMSQVGSAAFADSGMNFQEILQHYYPSGLLVRELFPNWICSSGGISPPPGNQPVFYGPVKPEIPFQYDEYVVRIGDSLDTISRNMYGDSNPYLWELIYSANRYQMIGPDAVRTGMILRLPIIVYNDKH